MKTIFSAALFFFLCTSEAGAHPLPQLGTYGVDRCGMDLSVKPGDDFDAYVNGTWKKSTSIPADRASWGMFAQLSEQSEVRTRKIIEEAAAEKAKKGSLSQKVGDYFAAYMNEKAINKLGVKPLHRELRAIMRAKTRKALHRVMGDRVRYAQTLINFYVGQDSKNPDSYIVTFAQSGLGLPDRDMYLKPPYAGKIDAIYKAYIGKLLTLAGLASAKEVVSRADAIFALEKEIAQAHWTIAKRRDPKKTYNKWSRADFQKKAPGIDWEAFFADADIEDEQVFLVSQPSTLIASAKIMAQKPLRLLKDYMAFHAINDAASHLSDDFVESKFDFYGKELNGTEKLSDRWKRGVRHTSYALGEAVGQIYVAKHFPPEAKAAMVDLVNNLRAGMKVRIESLDWMSDATKKQALAKLEGFKVKIGYPDKWRDYSKLNIKPRDHFGNARRAALFGYYRRVNRLGKPVDRGEWFMAPQQVNAYYNPPMSEIVFPAGILQAPFFDLNADSAVNYGGIGVVIGHEISHAFDDKGRQYDAEGKLRDWWTVEDDRKFRALAKVLGDQYAKFCPFPSICIKAENTMGENIADNAGMTVAWEAYQMSLQGKPAPVIQGVTGAQRFFEGFAQIWRSKTRDEALKKRVETNVHSPARYRVLGTVRNADAWYEAFDVKPGDKLYLKPEDRSRIW